ncbi:MAG: Lrp/AsnC family transcriptional regulator [Rhodospirillales bacterium]
MKYIRYKNGDIDDVDAQLLAALSTNGRISNAGLGRLVKLSAPTVAERLRRLEETGVIEGYTATINPAALGYAISAWVRIKPIPGQLQKVIEIVQSLPEIESCDRVTGEDCFVVLLHAISIRDMERIIDRILPFATTNTSIIQSSPLKRRLLPLKVRSS